MDSKKVQLLHINLSSIAIINMDIRLALSPPGTPVYYYIEYMA